MAYGFTPVRPVDLGKEPPVKSLSAAQRIARSDAADAIAFAQMNAKWQYDQKHKPLTMQIGDWALLRLHRGYNISSTARIGRKLSQQYVGPFRIVERVGSLAYKLDIPDNWRIHPVFTIAQLEPCSSSTDDAFKRIRPTNPDHFSHSVCAYLVR